MAVPAFRAASPRHANPPALLSQAQAAPPNTHAKPRKMAVEAALARQSQSKPPSLSDALHSLTVFVVGSPGSGKTSQCHALSQHYSLTHIPFDDLLWTLTAQAEEVNASKTGKKPRKSYLGFIPSFSGNQWKSILKVHGRKESIPSVLRSRLLYQYIQHQSQSPHCPHRYLIDGYLESEEDWNEWVLLVRKRAKESTERKENDSDTALLSFLAPVIVRLVCSESMGQLRWRRQALLDCDALAKQPAVSIQSMSEIKDRAMRYSLQTRPLIYRLGMQLYTDTSNDTEGGSGGGSDVDSDNDDSDDDADTHDRLQSLDGLIVKRVDAECAIDQCYRELESLVKLLLAQCDEIITAKRAASEHQPWKKVTGYESDDENLSGANAIMSESLAQPLSQLQSQFSSTAPDAATRNLAINTAIPSSTAIIVAGDDDDSPIAVNWSEDPEEARLREAEEREEAELRERNARMLRLIEAEEARWREAQEREDRREREKIEQEIQKLKFKEEEIEAEPGHIRTRRDDRFVTFISVTCTLTLQMPAPTPASDNSDSMVWIEIYRGFEQVERMGEMRWISVMRTLSMPLPATATSGTVVQFPRTIVNTWRLSGNERERPIMLRLVTGQQSQSQSTGRGSVSGRSASANNIRVVLGESRTMLQHLLDPPENQGLTLTFHRPAQPLPQQQTQAVSAPVAFVSCSRASLHTLLKPNKIIPPNKLTSAMADDGSKPPVIPTAIPITPSNLVTPVNGRSPAGSVDGSPANTPPMSPAHSTRPAALSSPPVPPIASGSASSHSDPTSRLKRTRSVIDHRREEKEQHRKQEEETERILREMDQQIGFGRRRAASFDANKSRNNNIASKPAQPAALSVGGQSSLAPPSQPSAAPSSSTAPSIVESVEDANKRLAREARRRKKESKAEAARRILLEQRRKRKREEIRELERRAASRERRKKELAKLKKKTSVQRVSLLGLDCAAFSLPKQGGIFSSGSDRFYLQVYRKRDRIKERERAVKVAKLQARGLSYDPTVRNDRKLDDILPVGARNCCIKPSQRHFLKPELFSIVYTSPVYQSLAPIFNHFVVPIDDQPLVFVIVASQCHHKHSTSIDSERVKEHEGKDRIVGIARLTVEDIVKIAIIQQREWEVEVYSMVEKEKEKELTRERLEKEREKSGSGRRIGLDDGFEEFHDTDCVVTSEKNRVSVLMKDPKTLEKEKAERAKRREERRKRQGASATTPITTLAAYDSDSDEDEPSVSSLSSGASDAIGSSSQPQPLFSFFALSFFSTRPVKSGAKLVEYDRVEEEKRRVAEREHRARVLSATAAPSRAGSQSVTSPTGGTGVHFTAKSASSAVSHSSTAASSSSDGANGTPAKTTVHLA